jgi:hypothetical protein
MRATMRVARAMARRGQEIGLGQTAAAQVIAQHPELPRIDCTSKHDHRSGHAAPPAMPTARHGENILSLD